MHGAGITVFGGSVHRLTLDEPRQLAPDEVVIDVHAAGVGNWDDLVRVGSWQVGGPPPMALGVEAAGTIAAIGEAVTGFAAGDEVLTHPLPLKRNGTWAQKTVAPATTVALKPPAVPFEAAAALPVPALTAVQVLDEALEIQRGEWVLIHGAGGVTGSMLVQLAAVRGARVIATASRPNASRLFSYGAKEVLDYHDGDWPAHVGEITGDDGVSKAANAARDGARTALRAVAAGGRLATITSDPPNGERNITISNVYVRPDGKQLTQLAELLSTGVLTLDVASARPLDEAAAALADATSRRARGAVVLSLAAPSEVGT
jgi:NADPH:quinone reductase-like Zn-dependent oxidoreductase